MTQPVSAPPEVVRERLAAVRSRIASAGGDPERVRVVAVTKGFGVDAVEAAVAAGVEDVGENYAQELLDKAAARAWSTALRWHFLGSVQRNKIKRLAPLVSLWEAVDRASVGEALGRVAPGAAVLVEVNLAGEASRPGCGWPDAPGLVRRLGELGLDVRGVMGVAPAGDRGRAREGFARLAGLAGDMGLPEVSMGMSDDFEDAVAAGSTMIRIGRALFGPRPDRDTVRR